MKSRAIYNLDNKMENSENAKNSNAGKELRSGHER